MEVVWTWAARSDINSVRNYIAADNSEAADAICERIIDAIERLSSHPRLGRPGRLTGTRELAVGGTPYVVVYVVDASTVAIFRVLHGAMNWPRRD